MMSSPSLLSTQENSRPGSKAGLPQELEPVPKKQWPKWLPFLAILGFFTFHLLIVSPSGDFPLNDDWAYGHSVKLLCDTGRFDLGASCATCFLQLLWEAAVCKVTGFSYTVMRIITLFTGLVGTVALYGCFRELRLNRATATLFTLTYAANPLFMNLSYSSMTDVPAISLTNLFLFFLLKSIRTNGRAWLLLSGCALVAAIAVRQTALIYTTCSLWLLLGRKPLRDKVLVFVSLLVTPVISMLLLQHWMQVSSKFPAGYSWYKESFLDTFTKYAKHPLDGLLQISSHCGQLSFYIGLFCAPVLIAYCLPLLKKCYKQFASRCSLIAGAACTLLTVWKVVCEGKRLMPFNQNLLRVPALGASTIMGVNIPPAKPRVRGWMTGLSGFMSVIFLAVLSEGLARALLLFQRASRKGACHFLRDRATSSLACFTALAAATSFLILQTLVLDLDRYYLTVMPPALMCLALCWRWLRLGSPRLVPLVLVLMLGWYSTMATEDYLGWNRARWQLLTAAERQGVDWAQIDGGSEYNFERDELLANSLVVNKNSHCFLNVGAPPRNQWRWWPVHGEKFIVSFSPIPDYDIVSSQSYWSGLTNSYRPVLLLQESRSKP